jgi:hypothetical protein
MAVVAPTIFATITTSPLVGTAMLNVTFRSDITDPGAARNGRSGGKLRGTSRSSARLLDRFLSQRRRGEPETK